MLNHDSPSEIRKVLAELNVRLHKRWGQHFLINRTARQKIAALVDPHGHETVWEIGPGLGALTELLLPRVEILVAFEIDRGLIRFLRSSFAGQEKLRLVPGDALRTWPEQLAEHGLPHKIAGNLPYGSASALVADLAERRIFPERMVFTVQREMAARMRARPGSKNYSSFSVLCQSAYRIEEELQLKPGSFFPPPEVVSSVVMLRPRWETAAFAHWGLFLRLLRILFRSRRKTVRNNLLAGGLAGRGEVERLIEAVREAGIEPGVRGERLSYGELMRMAECLSAVLQDL